ncbi:MAG: DMT family transporter [Proteobacteria bacterium]|nr:DMT family transporter [Pseudomonadota bacterium]
MKPTAPGLDAAAWTMLVVLSVLWGGSFLYVKVALVELPPVTVVALRATFGGALLLLLTRMRGLSLPRDRGSLFGFAGLALLNTVIPFVLIAWGQQEMTIGLAAILNAATPLSTLVLAHFLTDDEPLSGRRAAGVLVGFAGVIVLVGPEALTGLGTGLLAQLACVLATVSYGFALIWARRMRGIDGVVVASGQFLFAAPVSILLACIVDRPWNLPLPGTAAIASVAGLAVLSTAAAYVVYFRLMQRYGAGNASLVTMLIPPSAMLLGAVFLGERPDPMALAGFALIVAGLSLVDGRVLAFFRR